MQNEPAFGDGGKGRVEETGEKDVVRLESNLLTEVFRISVNLSNYTPELVFLCLHSACLLFR